MVLLSQRKGELMSTTTYSETITENIFRGFYGSSTFIEKSAIPKMYGFKSKKGTEYKGYPDFFRDETDYSIIVETKAIMHSEAEDDLHFYMLNNKINKDLIGIAVSGQIESQIKVTYYYKPKISNIIEQFKVKDTLLSLKSLEVKFNKHKYGETISDEELISTLRNLNNRFHDGNKIRDTDRSLFFSGLMISLTNDNFRSTYKSIAQPSKDSLATAKATISESHNLNNAIVNSISEQLASKINSLSKEYNWKDKFSFIKNIDFSLSEYKEIIETIETKIYQPYKNDEKQDILGKAYKIFLSRAGKIDNKNIILTPDHIKELMIKLARLTVEDVVLDTCTGSGGFLMEAMEKMINLAKEDDVKIENIKDNQLVGFEIDSVLFALACSNMFLHGDGRTNLLYRSSLLNDQSGSVINSTDEDLLGYIREKKPTKCIINPPYEKNNPIKFSQQAIDYLEPNGKLIIIMPTPTLTKNSKNGGLTLSLLKKAKLDFVIRMPKELFNEQKRTVNTSIFGFTKTPHDPDDEVLFYNMSDDGLISIQHKGRVDYYNRWNDIENMVLEAINNSKEIEGFCEKKKIFKEGDLIPSGVQNQKKSKYPLVKIKDLFDYEKGSLQSSKADEEGKYDFITASKDWSKHGEYTHDCEAIIYAVQSSGSLGRSHYVKGKFITSNLCLLLTKKKDSAYELNMEFYNIYFKAIREQLVADLAEGSSKMIIDPTVFEEYYIEYIPIDVQNNYVSEHLPSYLKIKKQYEEAEKKMEDGIKNIL